MNNPTKSAPATTKPLTPLERLVKSLDPEFPSVVIPTAPDGIADQSQVYGSEGRNRPAFVLADDANFTGEQ